MAVRRLTGAAQVTQQAPPPPPTQELVNFGNIDLYVSGGGLPDGNYTWVDLDVRMYQATDRNTGQARGPARLGVMITLQPAGDASVESQRTQFYSLGRKAHESFAPSLDGKGIVPVSGGNGNSGNLFSSTNWAYLLKSLYDCNMPQGYFINNLTPMVGLQCHMQQIPEPEERKNMRTTAQTGEADQFQGNQNSMIAVVSEVYNAPWEPKPQVNGVAKHNAPVQHVAQPVAHAPATNGAISDQDLLDYAKQGVGAVLQANPNGCSRLVLTTSCFKFLKEGFSGDESVAAAVAENFFKPGGEDNLAIALGDLGYRVNGLNIVRA